VSDADDGMASVQVQVFLTFIVPYLASFALHNVYVEERINVE
jgi:hypothetical protein